MSSDLIKLSADSEITVTVKFKYSGTYDSGKIRTIHVGDKEVPMQSADSKDDERTITCSPAKEVIIAGNGVKILEITTK